MTTARAAAIETLKRIGEALKAGIEPEDRHHLAKMQRQATALLEQVAHRDETLDLVERMSRLDEDLAATGRSPRERVALIRDRLGLSRARYYRLKSLASERDNRRV